VAQRAELRLGGEGSLMTETLVGVSPPSSSEDPPQEPVGEPRPPSAEELAAARELVKAARDRGVALTGPDGLLKALTKTVVETALDEEMSEHLGYDKHAVEGRNRENSRNGKRSKTIVTEAAGEVVIEVPRDRDGTFAPQVVKKRQRRLSDLDAVVISLYSKGPDHRGDPSIATRTSRRSTVPRSARTPSRGSPTG
jgi:putative transposase